MCAPRFAGHGGHLFKPRFAGHGGHRLNPDLRATEIVSFRFRFACHGCHVFELRFAGHGGQFFWNTDLRATEIVSFRSRFACHGCHVFEFRFAGYGGHFFEPGFAGRGGHLFEPRSAGIGGHLLEPRCAGHGGRFFEFRFAGHGCHLFELRLSGCGCYFFEPHLLVTEVIFSQLDLRVTEVILLNPDLRATEVICLNSDLRATEVSFPNIGLMGAEPVRNHKIVNDPKRTLLLLQFYPNLNKNQADMTSPQWCPGGPVTIIKPPSEMTTDSGNSKCIKIPVMSLQAPDIIESNARHEGGNFKIRPRRRKGGYFLNLRVKANANGTKHSQECGSNCENEYVRVGNGCAKPLGHWHRHSDTEPPLSENNKSRK